MCLLLILGTLFSYSLGYKNGEKIGYSDGFHSGSQNVDVESFVYNKGYNACRAKFWKVYNNL